MFTLNCKGRLLKWDQPIVMGIINATPDSFHGGSRVSEGSQAVLKAASMLQAGATLLDIGGQSTRPDGTMVGPETEMERVIPVIKAILQDFPTALISIDTYYASVAKAAVDAGALLVNDVSAGLKDAQMLSTVASLKVPYICMHHSGNPENLHEQLAENVYPILSVYDFFIERIEACKKAGILDLVIDPGFGFGKSIAANFQLIKELGILQPLSLPILLGVSRKSSIYKTLGITADEALNGTTVLHTVGLMNGAQILRVHDVKEAMEAIQLTQLLK